MINFFTNKENFETYLDKMENEAIFFSKEPFTHNPDVVKHLKSDIQKSVKELHQIYESYGCDIIVAQRLLKELNEMYNEINAEIGHTEEVKHILKILEKVLDRNEYLFVMPGKGIKGEYVKLTRLMEQKSLVSNKINLEFRGNKIYRDGREIQACVIEGNKIIFGAYHFTNEASAKRIVDDRGLFVKNIEDPYIYLLEIMDYSSMNEKEIKHLIGSVNATDYLKLKIGYDLDKVWLKVEKERPTHFALEGDVTMKNLIKHKSHFILHNKIEEL